MSYCVNCGVELDASARACPLCGTPVVNPCAPVQPDAPLPFPERCAEVAPVDRRGAGLTLSVMLAAAAACCAVLNRLFFFPDVPWSVYAVGGIFVFWVLVVSPLLWRMHPAARAALNVAAALAYTALVALLTHGWGWYVRLALPVALAVCLTLIGTVLLSQLIGGALPVIAEKFKIDPAVMASPLITTIVDTTTLLLYFNIAKMVLHI